MSSRHEVGLLLLLLLLLLASHVAELLPLTATTMTTTYLLVCELGFVPRRDLLVCELGPSYLVDHHLGDDGVGGGRVHLEHVAELRQGERVVVRAEGEEVGAQALHLHATTTTTTTQGDGGDLLLVRQTQRTNRNLRRLHTLIFSSSMALTLSAAPGPGMRFQASGLKI